MKKYVKNIISVTVALAIMFSMVVTNSYKAGADATVVVETTMEVMTTQEFENQETTSVETNFEETTAQEMSSEETTSVEEETVNYNENQNRIANQIKNIPESSQEDYMDKVKALYIDYLTLTEDEVKGLSTKDKAEYESILAKAGEINHTDVATGVSVSAENLPWYVKVIAEKTDETLFQQNYEEYIDSLYAEWEDDEDYYYDEDEEDDEDYYYDEDEEDDEDYYYDEDEEDYEEWYDEEDLDSEDDEEYDESDEEYYEDEYDDSDEEYYEDEYEYEDYEDDEYTDEYDYVDHFAECTLTSLGYTVDSERYYDIASSYNISLYNILEEKEYTLPEGMKVKVSLPYINEYLGYGLEIVHLKSDNSYEEIEPQLFNKTLGKVLTYGLYNELYGPIKYFEEETESETYVNSEDVTVNSEDLSEEDTEDYSDDEDYEDEELDEDGGWDEEAYRKWAEEQNSIFNVDEYIVEFETESFSEFAVMLSYNELQWTTKSMLDEAVDDAYREEMISPKTGNNISMPIVAAISSGLLIVVSLIYYRKKEEDIV